MKELAYKYFRGEVSPAEEESLWKWVNASGENRKEFRKLKALWKQDYRPDSALLLSYNQLIQRRKAVRREKAVKTIRSTAAVLAAVILGAAARMYWPGETVCVRVPNGETAKIELGDGTVVNVNSGSTFSYPSRFSLLRRDVNLEGEAYFEVARDRLRPFTVSSGDCAFRVLGTKFNISSYRNEPLTAVLVEGSLQFSVGSRSILMTPGDLITHQGTETNVQKVDPARYCGWTDGLMVLNKINLVQLLDKIEREKDVQISLDTRNFEDRTLRASFTKDDPVEGILKTITGIYQLGYHYENGVWHITENK